jgi:energy-coupling factor transporter ATP-binding protein EcfA2
MAEASSVAPGRVRADELGFWYRTGTRPAFRDVSFDLAPGSCLLVVGPSGSGKSSLGLAVAGLVPGAIPGELAGSMMVGGTPGVVFQDPGSQLVMERVEDEAAFGLENLGWSREAMLERVAEVLYDVGLADLLRRRSSRLSGGQQQRLALAGALAPRPGILVLDEPTANLDPVGATDFFGRLRALLEEGSTTVILVEHRVDAAWPLADQVLALDGDGSPIDVGPSDLVLARSGERMARAGIWLPTEAAAPAGEVSAKPKPKPRSRSKGQAASAAAESTLDIRSALRATGDAPILSADGLRFGYEREVPVIRDVSLSIAHGERVALVGPNGGGKSTLGRLLVGLLRPDRGAVDLDGHDPSQVGPGELARLAGYVFQDPESGFLTDTVADEVGLGLRPEEAERVPALMRTLGLPLETFGPRSPYRLSGGEARRLSLAVALVRDPAVLVLDEPTFGQDRHGYDGLLRILLDRVTAGTALVVATHDLRLVRDLGARVIEIDDGWLVDG